MCKSTELKTRRSFKWVEGDEPHATRRMEILAKHGDEIRKLMGPEWRTIPIVIVLVAIQVWVAIAGRELGWGAWLFTAYVVGGTINHALFLAIHEICHMLAMKSLWGNRLLSCIANIPIGLPYSATFHGYHMEHHKYQGWDGVDTDLPSEIEGKVIGNNIVMKLLFCVFQILFYALRPIFVKEPKVSNWTALNFAVQIPVTMWLCQTVGSMVPWYYFIVSTFFAGCLHPVSGHFLAEHFEYQPGVETYSYYGPLNMIAFNVGYHNEHHDFPNVAWSNLPKIRKIAPEYYDNLPQCPSWPGAIWEFIISPKMSAWSRIKRHKRGDKKSEE
eukprot:TRINITY_DN2962_c0_g7_i1.p1 TRINITY_DN2962_c0_g7~~TRINITY_DN2962_c0_g7_i1.p1  ORF type:complete len:329 (+),score=91.46 TRINITY_DN2962_c0_g7_i1:124-1110(+)